MRETPSPTPESENGGTPLEGHLQEKDLERIVDKNAGDPKSRKPPIDWPYHNLFDEGPGPSLVGSGDIYNIVRGPEDLRQGGSRVVEDSDQVPGLHIERKPTRGSDLMGDLDEEDDEAAAWLRENDPTRKTPPEKEKEAA